MRGVHVPLDPASDSGGEIDYCRLDSRAALVWATLYLTLWGLVVWSLAIVSSIPGVRWNENLLVLVPLDIVLQWETPNGPSSVIQRAAVASSTCSPP